MKMKIILVGGAVVVAAIGWFVVKPMLFGSKAAPVYTDQQIADAPRPTVTLEERVLNLKAPATAPNYVKAVIALEFADPKHQWIGLKGAGLDAKNKAFQDDMKPEMHRIWDIITSVVGAKSVDQVSSSDGREKLKQDLVASINQELKNEKVESVYFVTFITQ